MQPLDASTTKAVRIGLVGAATATFVALSGVGLSLDDRTVISPVLSLGYLALFVVPVMVGLVATKTVALEGIDTPAPGMRDVGRGALAGALSGAGYAGLVALLGAFDIRDPLVNWSPLLHHLLTFDLDAASAPAGPAASAQIVGALIWLTAGAALGAGAAATRLLSPATRSALTWAIFAVVAVALVEQLLNDVLESIWLEWLERLIYVGRGGLNALAAFVIAALAFVLTWVVRRPRTSESDHRWQRAISGTSETASELRRLHPLAAKGLIALGVAAVIVVPPFFAGKFTNELLANVGIYVLLALGLNVVVGMAGLLDLGYVAFFAVGGYTTAILTSARSPGITPELPWVAALGVVVVMAVIAGVFIGAPVMRLRGDYLAIVTLGFGEIIRLLALSDWLSGLTGGAQGITQIPSIDLGVVEVTGTDSRAIFLVVAVFCAFVVYASWRLERSRIGRAWTAIREDETVAESMGIDTVAVKLLAFVVGAVFAAFAGAISTAKVGSIFPHSFEVLVSVIILVIVIVGGMGNIAGVIAGAALLIGVLGGPNQPGLLAEFAQYKLLLYGALLVWVMLRRPEGLIPVRRKSATLSTDDINQDAWLEVTSERAAS